MNRQNSMKTNRKNKQWMRNRDQLKTAKVFNVKMVRLPDGTFNLLGGENKVFIMKNQYSGSWVPVDTRDIACELNNSRITAF